MNFLSFGKARACLTTDKHCSDFKDVLVID